MKLLNYIKLTKVNIVYDDQEFTLSRKTKDYLMALLSSSFLAASYIFNTHLYSSIGKKWGLYFFIPILGVSLGYFVVTLVQYIESKRLKDKWFKYSELESVALQEKGGYYIVNFTLTSESVKGVKIENDLYFRQFISLIKEKGISVTNANVQQRVKPGY
jgi:hypothetical protein